MSSVLCGKWCQGRGVLDEHLLSFPWNTELLTALTLQRGHRKCFQMIISCGLEMKEVIPIASNSSVVNREEERFPHCIRREAANQDSLILRQKLRGSDSSPGISQTWKENDVRDSEIKALCQGREPQVTETGHNPE